MLMLKSAVLLGDKAMVSVRVDGQTYALCNLKPKCPSCGFNTLPFAKAEFRVTGGPVVLTGNIEPAIGYEGDECTNPNCELEDCHDTKCELDHSKEPHGLTFSPMAKPAVSPQGQKAASPFQKPASPFVKPASPFVKPASPFQKPASPFQKPASPGLAPANSLGAQMAALNQAGQKRVQEQAQPAKKQKVEEKPAQKQAPPAPAKKAPEPAKKAPEKEEKKEQVLGKRRLPSGVVFEIVKAGAGSIAKPGQKITVKYCGRLAAGGKQFDKGSIPFRLGGGEVIRGWDEGCKGMLKGEKRKLFIPAALAYGRNGAPPDIPRNADLVFDVELLRVG